MPSGKQDATTAEEEGKRHEGQVRERGRQGRAVVDAQREGVRGHRRSKLVEVASQSRPEKLQRLSISRSKPYVVRVTQPINGWS